MNTFHDRSASTPYPECGAEHDCAGTWMAGPLVPDRRRTDASEARPRVLLLLAHSALTRVAIERAADITAALDGALHVLMRVPIGTRTDHPALLTTEVCKLVARRLHDRPFDFEVVAGDVVDQCTALARIRRFSIVVVDGAFSPADACRLVSRLDVPVFVARNIRGEGEVVAASDLRRAGLPVLTVARQFASPFHRKVTFFHNAKPVSVYAADPLGTGVSFHSLVTLQDDQAAAREARLRNIAGTDPLVCTMLDRAPSTVDAIVAVARERDADVIAVGHRRRSWFARLFKRDVGERVVARVIRSVLLVPLRA